VASGVVWFGLAAIVEATGLLSFYSFPGGGALLIVLGAWASGVCGLAIVYFQVTERPIFFNFLNLIRGISILGLAYFLIEVQKKGVEGYLWSITAANFLAATFSLLLLRKNWQFRFNPPLLREMLKFSSPFVPTMLGAWLLTMGGRFFLSTYSTLEEVALYTFLSKVSLAYFMCATAINTALSPVLYRILAENPNAKEVSLDILRPVVRIYGLGALAFIVIAGDLGELMGGGVYELPPILLSLIIVGHFCSSVMGGSSDVLLSYFKKTKLQMYAFLAGASLCILLNLVLAPTLGVAGILLATTSSLVFIIGCHWVLISRMSLPSVPVRDVLGWMLTILLLGLIIAHFKIEFLGVGIGIRVLISSLLLAFALLTLSGMKTPRTHLDRTSAS
tara:strand:+ start:550 stop:1719 length:1170 start_codon:yes stop_codon:yes gene_type:complete